LDRELERVRKLDYAFDNEEAEKGGSCIGSGTYDDKGRQVAGHSLSAPSNRMDKAWGPWVKEVAEEIFRALEYRAGVKAA
jgi:DNA-binding IclR family transcriptional regulator